MEKMTIKKKRQIAKSWLETPAKQEYAELMDKMEANDLRSIILKHAIQHYHGETAPSQTKEVIRLKNYYSHPLMYQKEILTL